MPERRPRVLGISPSSRDQAMLAARRRLAPTIPTQFGENFEAMQQDVLVNNMSISANMLLEDFYDTYLGRIERATGKRFPNPRNTPEAYLPERARRIEPGVEVGPGGVGVLSMSRDAAEAELLKRLSELRKDNPDLPIQTPEQIREDIGLFRAATRAEAERVLGRADLSGRVGALLGGASMAIVDPPVLASMLLGAPAAAGVLRTALLESAINVGSEAIVQTIVQRQREQFGEDPSFEEAFRIIAFAAVGGALVGGTFRAGARALQRGFVRLSDVAENRAAARAAEDMFVANATVRAQNPLARTARGEAEHLSRMVREDARLRGVIEERITDEPQQPAREETLTQPAVNRAETNDPAEADVRQAANARRQQERANVAQQERERQATGAPAPAQIRARGEPEAAPAAPQPGRRDVTETHLSYLPRLKPQPRRSQTEQQLIDRLPDELSLGFVSKALRFGREIRQFVRNKNEQKALVKLLRRGDLKVERPINREQEFLVKAEPLRTTPAAVEPADTTLRPAIRESGRSPAEQSALARVARVLDDDTLAELDAGEVADALRTLTDIAEAEPNTRFVFEQVDEATGEVTIREATPEELLDELAEDEALARAVKSCTGAR